MDLGHAEDPCRLKDRLELLPGARGVPEHRAALHEVVEGQHGVGLAAAEGGLELNHGLAAAAGHPGEGLGEQPLHAGGHVGAAEELHGVLVLALGRTGRHLGEVRGKLRLAVDAAGDVGLGAHHVAPRGKGLRREGLGQGPLLLGEMNVRRLDRPGGHGPVLGAVANHPHELADLLGLLAVVEGLQQQGHGLEAAGGLVVRHVLAAAVRHGVTQLDELIHPRTRTFDQLGLEGLPPVDVDEPQGGGDVQRVHEVHERALPRQVHALVLKEPVVHAGAPPVRDAVDVLEADAHVVGQGVEQEVEALVEIVMVAHGIRHDVLLRNPGLSGRSSRRSDGGPRPAPRSGARR